MANYRLRLSKPERDKAIILNLIRKSGPLSRTKVKNITGIRIDLIIGKVCAVIKEVIQKAKNNSTKILGVGVGCNMLETKF